MKERFAYFFRIYIFSPFDLVDFDSYPEWLVRRVATQMGWCKCIFFLHFSLCFAWESRIIVQKEARKWTVDSWYFKFFRFFQSMGALSSFSCHQPLETIWVSGQPRICHMIRIGSTSLPGKLFSFHTLFQNRTIELILHIGRNWEWMTKNRAGSNSTSQGC